MSRSGRSYLEAGLYTDKKNQRDMLVAYHAGKHPYEHMLERRERLWETQIKRWT